jgi:hypothetical protein
LYSRPGILGGAAGRRWTFFNFNDTHLAQPADWNGLRECKDLAAGIFDYFAN